MPNHQERVNYVITEGGIYVGNTVNHPCVVEAKSLEELKKNAKLMYAEYLEYLVRSAEQPEPLEFKELTLEEFHAQK